jgi:putative mRNA 3-end processing factor
MIELGEMRISLDRRERDASADFISHAHSDHIAAAKRSESVYASTQTAQLIECAYGISIIQSQIPGNVQLVEAGHMLGSRQLYIDDAISGTRVVYTGDFQMERLRTSEPIRIMEADCVILDSTFHHPAFSFGSRAAEEERMINWIGKTTEKGIVLFSAYRMGKAQELISLLNGHGIIPVVSRKIARINALYEANGVPLDYIVANGSFGEGAGIDGIGGNFVGISEESGLREKASALSEALGRKVYTAVATGFAKVVNFRTDNQFVLSDHADFNQAIDYIEMTGARKVYTYGQNKELFARNLVKGGYDASALPEPKKFE